MKWKYKSLLHRRENCIITSLPLLSFLRFFLLLSASFADVGSINTKFEASTTSIDATFYYFKSSLLELPSQQTHRAITIKFAITVQEVFPC